MRSHVQISVEIKISSNLSQSWWTVTGTYCCCHVSHRISQGGPKAGPDTMVIKKRKRIGWGRNCEAASIKCSSYHVVASELPVSAYDIPEQSYNLCSEVYSQSIVNLCSVKGDTGISELHVEFPIISLLVYHCLD